VGDHIDDLVFELLYGHVGEYVEAKAVEAALRQVDRDATERAAKVCDEQTKFGDAGYQVGAWNCAVDIRATIPKTEEYRYLRITQKQDDPSNA
jgi:hypothetical protein